VAMRIPAKILARAAHGPVLLKVRHGRASRAMRQIRILGQTDLSEGSREVREDEGDDQLSLGPVGCPWTGRRWDLGVSGCGRRWVVSGFAAGEGRASRCVVREWSLPVMVRRRRVRCLLASQPR
jgi:hypothetical protein